VDATEAMRCEASRCPPSPFCNIVTASLRFFGTILRLRREPHRGLCRAELI